MKQPIPKRYYALVTLIVWGAAILSFGLLRFNTIGIEEGAAKDLLMLWSVVDKIASPVGTFGTPDLRTFLLLPVSLYWSGSIIAAKVFTMLIMFSAVFLLFQWHTNNNDKNQEGALLASALLLLLPLTITQIDMISVAPYLLLMFAFGHWLHGAYSNSGRHLGGWYFTQLFTVMIAVSLHPAAIAYPLALAWHWYKNKNDDQAYKTKSVIIGTLVATSLVISFRMGWQDGLAWMSNPIQTLSDTFANGLTGVGEPASMIIGLIIAVLLAYILYRDRQRITTDFLTTLLTLALIIGLVAADGTWALLACTLLLYRGIPILIELNQKIKSESLLGQRGLVIITTFLLATTFMLTNKEYTRNHVMERYSDRDILINTLCHDHSPKDAAATPFVVASQWPAQTMLNCRGVVFPLPKAAVDGPTLAKNIKGITHLIFDHNEESNKALAANIADLGGTAQTSALQNGGVIVTIRNSSITDNTPRSLSEN
ncbi:hypothetical protein MNBD_GAMMA19-1772 [hydrothermal vent metagenome]|uniref:Glycosyltransferase RgtA/B/C/D-like domain-containing protein n=1 Tax=hydrothermal vent metagenome TaxID=652676 RepID=A0A3B1ATX2_9ZZZZ